MKILLGIIGIYGFCSCSFGVRQQNVVSLEGEWILVEDTTEIFSHDLGLKFRDDTLLTIRNSGLWQEGKYTLKHDTVYIEGFGGQISTYLILDHVRDTLTLFRHGKIEKLYNRQLEYDPSLKFDKIILKTRGCYGDCPEFVMSIHYDGKVNFKGVRNAKFIGDKEFKMDGKKVHRIDSLFKWSFITRLDTAEYYGAVDGWAMNVMFYYNGNKVTTVKGTSMEMPVRLKRIIGILTNDVREKELI